jgi:oligopeptide/dipeptide ABC transporter ATP-binding protein
MTETLLEVTDLKVTYAARSPVRAVDGVTFDVKRGENLGIVGESGCGKTTVARALMALMPANGQITGGSIRWDGREIANARTQQLQQIRWKEIALVPQSAMNSLDPVYRLRAQIVEAILTHEDVSKSAAEARANDLCTLVGIDPGRLNDYPHQLSGGMKQRLVIAMALALNPRLIIADEPTTALDVIVQDRILKQIIDLQEQFQFAMIYISHDIGVIAETCHRIAVMYAGKIVECGPVGEVLKNQAHPYTMGLKNAFPDIRQPRQLISIPGHPPALDPPPQGCRFASRCPFATERCREEDPPLVEIQPGHLAAGHYTDRAAEMRQQAQQADTWQKVMTAEQLEQASSNA